MSEKDKRVLCGKCQEYDRGYAQQPQFAIDKGIVGWVPCMAIEEYVRAGQVACEGFILAREEE